ncbi:type VI secretion system baseplate subunit TssF [Pseudomonas protegens]|uniref:type VI secretion system baseplate subunit TssF n=1 Tax=Pseudomonas protegens TaxID=380021 RepID=UPI001B308388|nr:type VI secretion system baseplate subunit TssF [Pseudomonas protegens]MBP5099526.1 type VI secretion system baseplate subunit TssF [Pseudomonas protegens]MBP5119455.1 type VI secretion system baseplate subunit TssF [Pseudomonas protegens]MBP5126035.1 type VI secretion system baseplate subunit TssF [Pseudomonas protegens]QTU06285.1 type VI secretion system baseplate subunit TssF [Pseudomonas protegens]QTU12595.1 type VI secretion system baseplate subunit TssF [Pseudomonas protegens]
MSFNHYYQSELTALRQLGRRFAERSPALAPFLGQAGRDPDVERLLEGFAFLTGRLRQKLDDELPELSHSLMHLLWPNYMRPLPAFSILQFDPLQRSGPAVAVARDTPVESRPINEVRCRFRTCYPTEVLPLDLTALSYSVKGDGALLSLHLNMSCDGHVGELELSRLRLHLAGERYISQMLYLSLLRNLQGIELVPLQTGGAPLKGANGEPLSLKISASKLQPVGFAEEEALIPYPLNTFRGYRYLQEYFSFQDKFLFVDLCGLEVLHSLPEDSLKQVHGLELRFDIRRSGIQRLRPTLDNIKLYCTPIVNLFKHDALPIRLDGKQDEYLLLPAEYDLENCGVFSVDSVTGWAPGGVGYQDYVPFESFEHDPSFDVPQSRPHYSIRQRSSLQHDGLDTYLSFAIRQTEAQETLSIELTCTNQNLPRQLKLGDIDQPCEQTPDFLSFRNITAATSSFAPPLNRDFLWKLISNMSLNYLSLANVDALKVILETYDLPRYYDQHAERVSKRLLGGLKSIRHEHVDRLHRGLPLRGLRTELTIDPQGYIGEGDLFIFASVLNEFFALYASLNSYHELRVNSTQGEVYQWTPRMGLQPLL